MDTRSQATNLRINRQSALPPGPQPPYVTKSWRILYKIVLLKYQKRSNNKQKTKMDKEREEKERES